MADDMHAFSPVHVAVVTCMICMHLVLYIWQW